MMVKVKKKIMVVDDSATVMLMHRMVLSKHGHDLILANDGKEALDKARADRPDLVFLDVIMPGMTGFETCRALRALPGFENVPIIMLTTRGEPDSIEEGFRAGCTEYMTKPFDTIELREKLRHYLGE